MRDEKMTEIIKRRERRGERKRERGGKGNEKTEKENEHRSIKMIIEIIMSKKGL